MEFRTIYVTDKTTRVLEGNKKASSKIFWELVNADGQDQGR